MKVILERVPQTGENLGSSAAICKGCVFNNPHPCSAYYDKRFNCHEGDTPQIWVVKEVKDDD